MNTRLAIDSDVLGILSLQEKYLLTNLSNKEMRKGFVTTPFSEEQLYKLIVQKGVFVADLEDEIVGYIMASTWEYFSQWEIFVHMIAKLPLSFKEQIVTIENSFQYGPVCIDESQRGTELFPKLFETMRLEFAPLFPIGLTFINQVNQHSYYAHTRKLGMITIDEFAFLDKTYYTLAFDTSTSVLPKGHVAHKEYSHMCIACCT